MKILSVNHQLPSILYANVRSVLPKVDELRYTLHANNFDVFACSESWLNDQHDDKIIQISGYRVFREDRQRRLGGGVAVWVKDSIQVSRLSCEHPAQLECLTLHLVAVGLILVTLYVPPDAASRESEIVSRFIVDHVDEILNEVPNNDIVLCGDLNRLDVTDIKSSLDLHDLHGKETYGNAQLDYILVSDNLIGRYNVSDFPPIDLSKTPHIALAAIPLVKSKTDSFLTRTVYDLRTSNVQSFLYALAQVSWSFLDDPSLSLDQKCEAFHEKLDEVFTGTIPQSKIKCSKKDKPWMTNVLKDLINKRWAAYREKRFDVYNHLKMKIRREINKSKMLWTRRMQKKDLWKAVHTTMGSKTCNPIMTLISQFQSPYAAVTSINQALASVFLPSITSESSAVSSRNDNDWQIEISPSVIFHELTKLAINKASSDIPPLLYKRAAALLADPLHRLFRQSIEENYVPRRWKVAAVSPIPKNKTPTVHDVRPISLLPLPAKLLERIVLDSVKSRLLNNIGYCQFGYRPKSSTQCALVSLHEFITQFLDDKRTSGVIVVSYDYSKAFDRLRKDLILARLKECAFPQKFCCWIDSYLTQRRQYVRLGDSQSCEVPVSSGVPQGSVLGPHLFALTTGAFSVDETKCHMIKYADDTTICFPIFRDSTNQHIYREHQHLLDWSSQMDLKINDSKSKSLTIKKSRDCVDIHLNGVVPVDVLNILGVTFDSRCGWTTHFKNVVRNASRRFYALRVLRSSLTKELLILVYNSMLRSVLEYCNPLFLGISSTDKSRLDKIQRRFHRLLCGPCCNEECLEALSDRRRTMSLKFLEKIKDKHHILHHLLPHISNTGRYLLPCRRTNRRSNSFILMACELSNTYFTR